MHVTRSAYIGIAGVAAGLMMLAFAFGSGITPAHGQTPGATGTAAAGATTPAGTATLAAATTTPAVTATRGALTPSGTTVAGTPTTSAALPSTGTGSGTENGTLLWVAAGAGMLLALAGGTFALTGLHRRR